MAPGSRAAPPRELAHQFVDGVSDGRFKYIEEHYDTTRRELYDLSIDPNETRPIADSTLLETWAKRLAKHRVI